MKRVLILALSGLCAAAGTGQTDIKSAGTTVIESSQEGARIVVKIETHELDIGNSSAGPPKTPRSSSCTYSRHPCALVDRVEIRVNDRNLFIPRSAFCDLADLNTANLLMHADKYVLHLFGGDGAESYVVDIQFSASRITGRTVASATRKGQPLETTTYHPDADDVN